MHERLAGGELGDRVGIAAAWKRDASLPNDTLPAAACPLQAWPSAAISLSGAASKPGIVDSRSNSMKHSGSTARIAGSSVRACASISRNSASGSSKGRWRISNSNAQSRGTMLSAVPPRIVPVCSVVYATS